MSGYYADKLKSLRDMFGTTALTVGQDWLQVGERRYPIVDDVIVLLDEDQYPPNLRDRLGVSRAILRPLGKAFAEDIQSTFGEEWRLFPAFLPEHEAEFQNYFDLVDTKALGEMRVCDLGCGIGRWSFFLKDKCRELVLLDFSEAIFVARRNLQECHRALFFMGNLNALPFRPGFADFLFCLGVLHHLPTNALDMVRNLKKYAGAMLIYLYYALDNRPAYFRWLLTMVTAVRLITARIRNPYFRATFTWLVACFVYAPLIWLGHFLSPIGLSRYVPLHVDYKEKSLKRIQQDVYDRFFTRIEQRFTRDQIAALTDTFSELVISERGPYWHFLCGELKAKDDLSIAAVSGPLERNVLEKPAIVATAKMQQDHRRWWAATIGSLLCLFVLLVFVTNVPTELTAEDIIVFEKDLGLKTLPRPRSFDDEIRTIRLVQARVFAAAPRGQGIPEYEPREPSNLMKYKRGLCYDRSRSLEKAFTYMGFKVRHVFLLYRKDLSLSKSLLSRGHPSHAVTEVKTSRGWLYVDSNQPWIAVARDGWPHGAGGIWKHFDEFDGAPEYVRGPWWAFRGLYSRKGALYAPYFPLPQFNWGDFVEWAIFEKLAGP
jgi:SAM-dependent methyltransferase